MITHFNHTLEKAEIWSVLVGKNYAGLKALFLKNTDLITDIHRNFNESFKRMKISQLQYDRLTLNLEDPIDADRLCNFFKRFTEGPNKFNPKLKWIRKTNQIKISVDIEEDYYERQRVNWWAILFYIRYIEYHQTFIDELGRSSSEASKSLLIDIRAASKGGRFLISYEGQVSEQEFDWIMGYVKTYGMDSQIYASQIGAKIKKEEGPEFILWSSGRRCRTRVTCDEPDVYAYYQDMREVLSIICRGEYYSIHGLVNSPARILLQGFCLLEKSINSISYSPDEDMVYLRMKEEKLAEGIELITTFRDALGLPSLKFDNEEGILSISISKGSSFNYNHQIFNLTVLHLFAWWLSIKRSSVPEALFPIEHPKPRVSRPDLALGQHHTSNTEVNKMRNNTATALKYDADKIADSLYQISIERDESFTSLQLDTLVPYVDRIHSALNENNGMDEFAAIIRECVEIEITEMDPLKIVFYGKDGFSSNVLVDLISAYFEAIIPRENIQDTVKGIYNLSNKDIKEGSVSLEIDTSKLMLGGEIKFGDRLYLLFLTLVYESYSVYECRRKSGSPRYSSRYPSRFPTGRPEQHSPRPVVEHRNMDKPKAYPALIREFTNEDIALIIHRTRKVETATKSLIHNLTGGQFNSVSISDDVIDIRYGIDQLFDYFRPFTGFRRSTEYPNVPVQVNLDVYIDWWKRIELKLNQIIDPETINKPNVFELPEIEKWIFLKELDMYVWVVSHTHDVETEKEPKDA